MERKALKGHVTTAQGNALGKKPRALSSPERAHYSMGKYALSGLETVAGSSPRALPWAVVIRAVGAYDFLKSTVLGVQGRGRFRSLMLHTCHPSGVQSCKDVFKHLLNF